MGQAYKSVMKMLESPNLPETTRVPGLVWHEAFPTFPDELFLDLYDIYMDHGGAGCCKTDGHARCFPRQSHIRSTGEAPCNRTSFWHAFLTIGFGALRKRCLAQV